MYKRVLRGIKRVFGLGRPTKRQAKPKWPSTAVKEKRKGPRYPEFDRPGQKL